MQKLNLKIANTVRVLRKQQNLSQEDLAGKSGLDRTYISGIERCTRNISINSLEKIILGLGISIEEFFHIIIEECNVQKK